jgi:hypothetical protein
MLVSHSLYLANVIGQIFFTGQSWKIFSIYFFLPFSFPSSSKPSVSFLLALWYFYFVLFIHGLLLFHQCILFFLNFFSSFKSALLKLSTARLFLHPRTSTYIFKKPIFTLNSRTPISYCYIPFQYIPHSRLVKGQSHEVLEKKIPKWRL